MRPLIAGVAATATLMAPVAAVAGKAPLERETRKCGLLRYLAKQKDKTVGPNICARGVRFKWVSKSGKRRHWGTRPALAREVAREIDRLRALLRPPPAPYGGGSPIPWHIVQCESAGSYDAYNPSSGARGRYQVIPSTHAAICPDLGWSPAEQDECAARIWRVQGPGAWACA